MKENNIDKEQMKILIYKYLKNKCTKQEFDSVYDVLSNKEQFEEFDDIWSDLWEKSLQESGEINMDILKEESMQLISPHKQVQKKIINLKKNSFIQWAAMFVVILGIGLLLKNLLFSSQSYHSPFGQIEEVELSDGSIVSLGATSNLKVPDSYSKTNRDLSLHGMAFFQVTKDRRHKFTIHTEAMKVTVLGTSFTVRSFDYESTSMVTVNTGKVQVDVDGDQGKQTYYVTPDQQLIYNQKTGTVSVNSVDSEKYKVWLQKKFYFNKTPLEQVISDLQNMYKVQINVTDSSITKYKITGEYDKASIKDILNSISFVYNLKFEYNSDGSILLSE